MQFLSVEEHQNHAGANNERRDLLIASKKHQEFSGTSATHGFVGKRRSKRTNLSQFFFFSYDCKAFQYLKQKQEGKIEFLYALNSGVRLTRT